MSDEDTKPLNEYEEGMTKILELQNVFTNTRTKALKS